MTAMLRPAAPTDRPDLIALALAEDAAWSGAPAVSAEEQGEFVDSCGPGVIFERDGRVAGYAAAGEGGDTVLLVDPDDCPERALEALVAWLGEQGHHEVDSYARDARRIAWLEANGFTHRRSFFDLQRGINPPLAPAVWPSEVAIARFRPGADDAAVHALIYVDAAWGEVRGHTQRSLEAWRCTLTPEYRGWVARRDERPVGWVAGRVFDDGRGWVEQLAVARSARGLGLGRALLLHSLAELCARGATSLATGVQAENENAIGLYRDVGFEVDREWRVYSRADALLDRLEAAVAKDGRAYVDHSASRWKST
jgi:ribosomal protein S18 acetylase RimI-like enzyme